MVQHVQKHFEAEPDQARLYDARMLLRTDPIGAIQQLKWLASRGSTMSMIYIGEAYARGTAGSIDLAEATRWYQMAADAGSAVAEHALAHLYMKSGSTEKALENLRSAVSKDYPPSICLMGRFYFWGRGVERDPKKGAEMCERAMRLGNLPAKGVVAKYLTTSGLGPRAFLRGLWLGICVRVQTLYVLRAEGMTSERLRF
jgi:uncharacterized protein